MERTFDLSPKALFTAAREGDANRISLCAKHGVDLNIHDPLSNDETPLHMAAARYVVGPRWGCRTREGGASD